MKYTLKYTDGRTYKSPVNEIIVKAQPEGTKSFCLDVESSTDKVLTLLLSKSEAMAITHGLSAALYGDCSATIKPTY